MKKLLFVFSFFLMAGMTLTAQTTAKKSCSKSCAKTCTKSTAKASASTTAGTQVASQMTEAEIAAEGIEDIKVKECSVSGSKSFYQKSVCAASGNVSWDQVEYCTKSKKFTKVAAASMERDVETGEKVEATAAKKSCSKTCTKTCSKKKASMK